MPTNSRAAREKFEKVTDTIALYQRDGIWYANIQWAGKQIRRSLKTESKKQAKLNALKLYGDLAKGQNSGRRDKATIAEVFETFIDWKVNEGLADRTLAKYRHGLKVALDVAKKIGRTRLHQIDPRYMDEFRAHRKKTYGSGANTIRKDLILIGGTVKFALSRKFLTEDPLAGYKIPKAKNAPQPCWSPEELEQIIKSCDRRPHQDVYAVLADSGMRIGELIHLTWEDIDNTRNVIQIRSKKEWKTKTGNHRAIPMTKRVQRLLAAQPHRSKWVFTFADSSRGHKAGRQVSSRRLLDYLKVRLKRLGLRGHLHTFRHSHASFAIARGVPADVLRSWLGHVDRKTLELYTHIASKTAQDGKQSSVADQVRACLSFALKDGLHVPRHLIFSDFAVTGRKENRPGLNQIRQAITNHEATVLLVLSTNRLFRGLFSSLKFVNESIVANNVRYVAVDRGLDSAKENIWRLVLSLLAIMDELSSTLYQGNIRAAHLSRAEKGEVWGALTFGYRFSDRDDAGSGSQRRRYEIDFGAADWVKRIFHWFTKDGISINEIVRRLCDTAEIPVPPWSRTGTWSRPVVSRVLRNRRYRGDWSYGWFDRIWNTAKDCVKIRKRAEPLQCIQKEELRIIDESLWHETQLKIAENKGDRGRKTSDGKRQPTTYLLSGLLYCKEHDQLLYRSGPKGEGYFRCPTCISVDAKTRPLFTFCDGKLAVSCLLDALQKALLGDEQLVQKIISACQSAVENQTQPGEAELEAHQAAIRKLSRSIDLLIDNPGESKADKKESGDRLKRLRAEKNKHSGQLEKLRQQMARPATVPTIEEVKAHLQHLSATIQRVIDDPNVDLDGLSAARNILRRFTGEKVLISQAGERRQHHGWLVAEFENDFVKLCADKLGGGESCTCGSTRVVVEIRRPDANAELGKTVVELRDQHRLPFKEIGRRLKMTRNRATRLYKQYSDAVPNDAGLPIKQGRCRLEQPLPERLADQVMELADQELLIAQICERLNISSSTATAAMQHWYRSRGLEPVDGRTRRKSLELKQRPPDPSAD